MCVCVRLRRLSRDGFISLITNKADSYTHTAREATAARRAMLPLLHASVVVVVCVRAREG